MRNLITFVIVLFSLTGCVNSIQQAKLITFTPDVPTKITKHSIEEYKNMSFNELAKNLPVKTNPSKILINCRTISEKERLYGENYLCNRVLINNYWYKRPRDLQNKIDSKLEILFNNITNELNKFCIAKGGFFTKKRLSNSIWNTCIIDNRPLLGYQRVGVSLKILTPNYFKMQRMSIDDKIKLIEKNLLKLNAVEINKYVFNIQNLRLNIFDLLHKYYPNLMKVDLYSYISSNEFKYKIYGDTSKLIRKKVSSILTDNKFILGKSEGVLPVVYTNNNIPVAVLLFKNGLEEGKIVNKGKYLLILLNEKQQKRIQHIWMYGKNNMKYQESKKEIIDY